MEGVAPWIKGDHTHLCFEPVRWPTGPLVALLCAPPSLGRAEKVAGVPGDHQAVAMRLTSAVGVARGLGDWLFPLALLDRYVDEARALISSFLEEAGGSGAAAGL